MLTRDAAALIGKFLTALTDSVEHNLLQTKQKVTTWEFMLSPKSNPLGFDELI